MRALRRLHIVPGDAVALLCANRPEFAEVLLACQRGGFRLTPVNWHLTGDEAAYIVRDCEARVLLADVDLRDVALATSRAAPDCPHRILIGGGDELWTSYEGALAPESSDELEQSFPGGTMLYTSGTTGRPKGVYRTPAPPTPPVNLYGYADGGGDVHLCTGPLYHAAPLAFSLSLPLAFGATVVLMESWDATRALQLIASQAVTHTHMVPTMFHRLLSLPLDVRESFDTSSVRHVLHGAAPCPVNVKRRMIEWWGPIIWEYYAATEGVGTFVDSHAWLERPGTVGRPAVDGHVLIGDEDGRPLVTGEVGLVYLRAPTVERFAYFKDDDKTADTFRGDYFTLGDVGYLDAEGYLYLSDRSTNLIISGGVNIYPAEVDAVLLDHPLVADAATIGVADDEWGEVVVSVVELFSSADASEELALELIELCRSHIAHFKCPRRVEFLASLPRQDNGKIYKRLLRDQFRNEAP